MKVDTSFSLESFHKRLQRDAAQKGIPFMGGFELTPRCNLSCKMCYVKFKGASGNYVSGELSAKQWIKIGKEAVDEGALVVFLTGGEPLVREDFKDIYKAYCKLGVRLNLFTNGTLITKEFAKWLSQSPPSTVDITLYGSSEETYQSLCGYKGAYQKVIEGIENLLENKINTRIKTTVVKSNLADYKEIKAIAKSYDLEFVSSNLIHGNRIEGIDNIKDERLSPDKIFEMDINELDKYNCNVTNFEKFKLENKNLPAMFCTAGKSAFFVNWQGRLLPCALFTEPFTEPLVEGFVNAWRGLGRKIMTIPSPNWCKECSLRVFCPVCPPRLQLETGSFEGHSEYICSLAKQKAKMVELVCRGSINNLA